MRTHSETPSSRVRPAACYRFPFFQAHLELERLPHKVRSLELLGYRLRHHTLSDISSSVKSRFTNSMGFSLLVELIRERIAKMRAATA
jgi:hypothetical protein